MSLAAVRNRKRTEIIAQLSEVMKGIEGEVFLVGSGVANSPFFIAASGLLPLHSSKRKTARMNSR
jgi:hypothetical protein